MPNYDEIIKNINVLLADDDDDYLAMTTAFLKQKGYNITKVSDGEKALEELKTGKYQIALLDYYMPKLNGEEVVSKIREENKEIVIILQTGFSGQKPPVDTLKNLNIQNYFDKTEGIDKLNIELISAVKVLVQQNEIKISEYKASAMGRLMAGISQEIKIKLMNIAAGSQVTSMIIEESENKISKENLQKINDIYNDNRNILDKIDKALSSIISQSTSGEDYIMTDDEIISNINLILQNDVRKNSIDFNINLSLKTKSYIAGNINDTVFIICDILRKLMYINDDENKIELVLTEDEESFIFKICSARLEKLSHNDKFIYENVILSLNNKLYINDDLNELKIHIKKY